MKVVKLEDIIDYCEAQIPHLHARGETVALAQLRGIKEFAVSESFETDSDDGTNAGAGTGRGRRA